MEPAWSFRLWESAISLVNYVVDNKELFRSKNIIEVGSGTGLVSIACSFIGARLTVCSDLEHAMPLLHHNVVVNLENSNALSFLGKIYKSKDFRAAEKDFKLKSAEISLPLCPSGHSLLQEYTVSDEYVCNLCNDEIDEDEIVQKCGLCNFDICHDCYEDYTLSLIHI